MTRGEIAMATSSAWIISLVPGAIQGEFRRWQGSKNARKVIRPGVRLLRAVARIPFRSEFVFPVFQGFPTLNFDIDSRVRDD